MNSTNRIRERIDILEGRLAVLQDDLVALLQELEDIQGQTDEQTEGIATLLPMADQVALARWHAAVVGWA